MPILNDDSLRSIKQENDKPKQTYGRPVRLISDLLETIYFLKKEKKKWQDLANKRGDALRKIKDVSTSCLEPTKGSEDDTNSSLGTTS